MKASTLPANTLAPQAPTGSMDELLDRAALMIGEGMSPRVPDAQRYNLRLASFRVLAEIAAQAKRDRARVIAAAWVGIVVAFGIGLVLGVRV